MRAKVAIAVLGLAMFGASSAFAGSVSFNFTFGGPDTALGTSQSYTSNGATITAYGFECSAATASSTDTLSGCSASALYQKMDGADETGLGLAGEGPGHEIGFDGTNADFVMGLDVSSLFHMGATSMTLSFGSVEAGEAFAVLGYGSDPFTSGNPFALTNTKAWVGNDGSTNNEIFSATFHLNADDQFLVLIAPCGASSNPNGPCGSNVTLMGGTAGATPEPGTLALFMTGLLALGFASRRRMAVAFATLRS